MKILMVGPQGSGKSTQAKLLAEFLHVPSISTGEIFREMAKQDDEVGRAVKQVLDSGGLVGDQQTAQTVRQRLSEPDFAGGFVMDGYPRNIQQVELFDPGFDKVIYLDVSDEEVIKRLLQRGREDDVLELIEERLSLYHKQTEPMLDHYKQKGLLLKLNGVGEIDQIQQQIRKGLNG